MILREELEARKGFMSGRKPLPTGDKEPTDWIRFLCISKALDVFVRDIKAG